MPLIEESNQRLREARRKLGLSLAVNGLVPLVLYTFLRRLFANDATALTLPTGTYLVIRRERHLETKGKGSAGR